MDLHRFYAWAGRPFRHRRLRDLNALMPSFKTAHILDVGGTLSFWRTMPVRPSSLSIINSDPTIEEAPMNAGQREGSPPTVLRGDGCALPFEDSSFDIVFSNSVIEHVGSWERQVAFAQECRRVGRKLWVQTPAYTFPFEPHLLAIGLHWLPSSAGYPPELGWKSGEIRRSTTSSMRCVC